MRRVVCLVVALCLLVLGTSALAEKKPGEGLTLTVYAGMMEDHAMEAMRQFSEATGVKAEMVRLSSGEALARIEAEKDNPLADVWYGGPADAQIQAKVKGLTQPYISETSKQIPDKFKDAEGYWTGIYLGYLGFSSNSQLLAELGIEAPTSWQDLIKPELKDQVSIASPASSGTAYTCLATIVQLMGEEAGMEYMKALNANVRTYEKSGTAPARLVGQGEATVGITFMHDAIKYREEGMTDIVITAPSEGTGYEIGAVSIIAGCKNLDAAKLFIDWCLTKEAQEVGGTVGSFQFLTNESAVPPELSMELKDTVLIDYDLAWAGTNRDALVEKWNAAVSG